MNLTLSFESLYTCARPIDEVTLHPTYSIAAVSRFSWIYFVTLEESFNPSEIRANNDGMIQILQ